MAAGAFDRAQHGPGPVDFYDTDALSKLAILLFNGWGYNFYRVENQLRADDQLVRSQCSWMLGLAAASVESAEAEYRREFLPAPSRARPLPDAAAVANAQKLENLQRALKSLVAGLHALPTPENDRMTQRYRLEAQALQALIAADELLAARCDMLRGMLHGQTAAWMLENWADIQQGLRSMEETLPQREGALMGRVLAG